MTTSRNPFIPMRWNCASAIEEAVARPVNRAILVQATHTASEELLYRALWAAGAEQPDGCSRVAALSYAELGLSTGRHARTVARALKNLSTKEASTCCRQGEPMHQPNIGCARIRQSYAAIA